eukprot:COSAG06_NODE_1339_length_9813_cov_44.214639_6_plen_77_part_00
MSCQCHLRTVALASTKCSVAGVDPANPSASQHLSLRERIFCLMNFSTKRLKKMRVSYVCAELVLVKSWPRPNALRL